MVYIYDKDLVLYVLLSKCVLKHYLILVFTFIIFKNLLNLNYLIIKCYEDEVMIVVSLVKNILKLTNIM